VTVAVAVVAVVQLAADVQCENAAKRVSRITQIVPPSPQTAQQIFQLAVME
jgi:hypothetical protein